ncbi:MAG: alkaline phosphatase family protein [Bacteroidales bacterium]|nr:alkaline phosphatase family protein [Bacteroidales bacterium]
MKTLVYSLILVSLMVFVSCINKPQEQKKHETPYLIVLSMDGFRWDYADMAFTPNFDKMALEGVRTSMQAAFPTKTFPNHYTLATGLYPDHHGIVNNSFFDPHRNHTYQISNRKLVQDGYFYGGEPIWNTAEKQGVKAATYFWVGSEADVQSMRPSIWKIYDGSISFRQRADSVIAWLRLPEAKRPHLIMWYVDEPDGIGHHFGPKSLEVKTMVQSLDSLLGYFFDKMNQLPIASQVNFIVVSDHGMEEISTERYINLKDFVDENLLKQVTGGNPVFNIWSAENMHDTLLSILQKIPHISAYDSNTIPERLNYMSNERCGDIVVVADSSWSIGLEQAVGNYVGGTHGYDNRNTNMDAVFYAKGPAFRKGFRGERFQNVDLYNLMTNILGLNPAPNDGDQDAFQLLK